MAKQIAYDSLKNILRLQSKTNLLYSVSSTGTKTVCDATQFTTCHGTLGEPTYLQLLPNAVGHQLLCKKMTQNGLTGIFRFKNNQIVFFNESFTSSIQDRWHFVPRNGTIIINPATKRDSGTYRVEIHNEETGTFVANTTIQLIVLGKYIYIFFHCSNCVVKKSYVFLRQLSHDNWHNIN